MVMEVVEEDMGEASMQCTNHPYKNNTPGGICAFCLQEKLGKLVSSSSSFPVAVFPSSSSSLPPFNITTAAAATSSLAIRPNVAPPAAASSKTSHNHQYYNRKSKLMFLSTHRKKKKKEEAAMEEASSSIVFKRSKSTTTPRRKGMNFLEDDSQDFSPHKKGFWSFLYLSSKNHPTITKKIDHEVVVVEENESPDEASINRKVSRSRSVGCGSRSFSGDFFERISTGFGDCTLRRVESQREGKHKVHRNICVGNGQERVKCGGIFSGFMITTSSSSSSSSSSYLVSSSSNEDNNVNGRTTTPSSSSSIKSWGWAFASPMRAFTKPSSNDGKRDSSSNKNATPNFAAIPSLLAVRS